MGCPPNMISRYGSSEIKKIRCPYLALAALAVSGQDTARFVFEGFLPVPKKERRERLEFLQGETRTVIFYEAPHKLRGTLDDLCAAFGAERSITLCRELTKLHEEITKTTIGEAVRYYEQNDPLSLIHI